MADFNDREKKEYLDADPENFRNFFYLNGVIREEDEFPKQDILDLKFEILDILRDELRNEGIKTLEKVTKVLSEFGFDDNLIYGPQGEMVFAKFMKKKVELSFK